jgi:hypothetical protein
MYKRTKFILLLFIIPVSIYAGKLHIGGDIGYRSGLSFQAKGIISGLSKDLPFQLRMAASYTAVDPGNALDARHIFINNNSNGTPEKEGQVWDIRLDFLYPVNWFSLKNAYFFAGPRYSWFTGRFDFVGGNEDFEIYSDSWGLGAGLETQYAINNKINLVLSAGLDFYHTDHMHGHDTTYYSDGETVNGREDYTYQDADKAVNQPKFVPNISIGINYLID